MMESPLIPSTPTVISIIASVEEPGCAPHYPLLVVESDNDYDEDDVSEEEDLQETAAARALVKAAFDRRLEASVLKRLLETAKAETSGPVPKKARVATGMTKLRRMSSSEPNIPGLYNDSIANNSSSECPSVQDLQDILKKRLQSAGHTYQTHAASDLQRSFFVPTSSTAYTLAAVQAVRHSDITALQRHYDEHQTLDIGNRFGESLLHIACRRGSIAMVEFLLSHVSCRVCCDYGRTVLHDACWKKIADRDDFFQLIRVLLQQCPDLLYVTDKRGHTSLHYIPSVSRKEWISFLESVPLDMIVPHTLGRD